MNRIPAHIAKEPIEEAVFEIRFNAAYPQEAVFGVFYPILKGALPQATAGQLPILQLPEAVRQNDPSLRYQPLHRLQQGNLAIGVGPNVISFINPKPYIGWEKWKSFMLPVILKLCEANVFEAIERVGLRYVNVFKDAIIEHTHVKFELGRTSIQNEPTTFRTEIIEGEFIKILQLANNVTINTNGQSFIGSLADIDIIKNVCLTNFELQQGIDELLHESHLKVKAEFFNLLRAEFIDTLLPTY